jgi:PAS domain S-box-containing protein
VARLRRRVAELEHAFALQVCEILELRARLASKRENEDALRQSKQRLRSLFAALPDIAFILDEDGTYVKVLTSNENLLYLPSDELEGRRLRDILPPDLGNAALETLQRALETGQPQSLEYRRETLDGECWFEGRTAPLHLGRSGKRMVIWISRDITARKRAEEKLLESEKRYALATGAGHVGIWEWNFERDEVYLDPHLCELLDYPEGRNQTDFPHWNELVSGEDFEIMKTKVHAYLQGDTPSFEHVCRVEGSEGKVHWLLARGTAIWKGPEAPSTMLGTFTDITERRKAEMARERLVKILKYRSTQLQTAAEVSRAVSSILDPQELIQQVADLICERFDLYYVGLFLVEQDETAAEDSGSWAVLHAGTGEAGKIMLEAGHRLRVGGSSMIGWCIANQEARIALDVGQEAVRFENPWLPKTRSELALPLISRGQAVGALTIQSAQEAAFSEEDIVVLQTMTDQLANAIVNARLFEQAQQEIAERREAENALRQRQQELELLNNASSALAASLDLDQVLTTVIKNMQELVGALACSVWLLNPQKQKLVCRKATGPRSELVRGWGLALGEGIVGWVAQHRESLFVSDAREDSRHYDGVSKKIGLDIRSILSVPLEVKDEMIGVLQVVATEVDSFDPRELSLMESLAATAAIAIDNAHLYEQTRQDAVTKAALLDEANHRVKNNLTAIMGILALELQRPAQQIEDFHALLRDILSRIQGMSTVHNLLSDAQWAPLPLDRLVAEVIYAALGGSPIRHKIKVRVSAPEESLMIAPRLATNLAIVINELTTNSIKHAFRERDKGIIHVEIKAEGEGRKKITLVFRDNGSGFPEPVLKGKQAGVGVRLMRLIVRSPLLDALEFHNEGGAVATLIFKLVPYI